MKTKIIAFVALIAATIGAASAQTLELNKMSITFVAGTDVRAEISRANDALAARSITNTLDDEFTVNGADTLLEIRQDDQTTLRYLVEVYFPSRPSVKAANYVYDDDPNETESEVEGVDDSSGLVVGGNTTRMTVRLQTPAPIGGAVVRLSTNSLAVTLPRAIRIPAGRTSAIVAVPTSAVTRTVRVRLIAKTSGKTSSAMLVLVKR